MSSRNLLDIFIRVLSSLEYNKEIGYILPSDMIEIAECK
jgi:hypothetical protein